MCKENYLSPADSSGVAKNILLMQLKESELLGAMVKEILSSDKMLNRKTLCITLLAQLDKCDNTADRVHYENIFRLLLGRSETD